MPDKDRFSRCLDRRWANVARQYAKRLDSKVVAANLVTEVARAMRGEMRCSGLSRVYDELERAVSLRLQRELFLSPAAVADRFFQRLEEIEHVEVGSRAMALAVRTAKRGFMTLGSGQAPVDPDLCRRTFARDYFASIVDHEILTPARELLRRELGHTHEEQAAFERGILQDCAEAGVRVVSPALQSRTGSPGRLPTDERRILQTSVDELQRPLRQLLGWESR